MKPYIIILVLLSSLTNPLCAKAPQKDSLETISKLDSIVEDYIEGRIFHGAILISTNGKTFYNRTNGIANLENNTLITLNSQFYIASVAKSITSIAILSLIEKDSINFGDTLRRYFSELPPTYNKITIRHLLTHSSGIPDYFGEFSTWGKNLNNEVVLKKLKKINQLNFEPGHEFSYSNSGYLLLSMIIEKVCNESFASYLKNAVFDPADMKNTFVFTGSKSAFNTRVIGYSKDSTISDYTLYTTGDGGLYSTAADLNSYINALVNGKIIKHETLLKAWGAQKISKQLENRFYGYGWILNKKENAVWHAGFLFGFSAMLYYDIENHTSVIILSNNSNDNVYDMLESITKAMKINKF